MWKARIRHARRVRHLVMLVAGLAVTGLVAARSATATPEQAAFILARAGFGPSPQDAAHVEAIGVDAWLAEQLHPEHLEMPGPLKARLAEFDSLKATPAQLYQSFGPPLRKAANGDEAALKTVDRNQNDLADQARASRLLRAIYSPAQLQETLVDFWFNHFNVFVGKDQEDRIWVGAYERDAIRPYVLAHFRELLGATAQHPAMLYYLDNWQSRTPVADKSGKLNGGLNENYAREVMELHTLGVDGGNGPAFGQQDVTELARILTGWGFDPKAMGVGEQDAGSNGFHFDPKRHDDGAKHFLGEDVPAGGGIDEGEHALDRLAASPVTARHLSWQLAQYFVADVPPPRLVARLSRRWLETDGDLREVMAALLASPEFRGQVDAAGHPALRPEGTKLKTPFQYVVSAVRATGEPGIVNVKPLLGALNQLGEPLYGCVTPDGYKNTEAAWLNADAMIDRLNFATALGGGNLPLLQPDLPDAAPGNPVAPSNRPRPPDAEAIAGLLGGAISSRTGEALAAAKPPQRAGLLLGSPEFMRR